MLELSHQLPFQSRGAGKVCNIRGGMTKNDSKKTLRKPRIGFSPLKAPA
jgi:hypothetical protein